MTFFSDAVHQLIRYPLMGLILLSVITAVLGSYAFHNFEVNSERSGLISPEADFRKNWDALQDKFPMYRRSIVVLIEAPSAQTAADSAKALVTALKEHDGLFKSVFSPAAEPFFREHGLLYQNEAELEKTISDLAAAQPALSSLAYDPSLRGLFRLLSTSVQAYQRGVDVSVRMVDLMTDISEVGEAVLANQEGALDWESALGGGTQNAYQIVNLQINEDYSQVQSGRQAIQTIKELSKELGLTPENEITVSLTGSIPLADDEMQAVAESIGLAGLLSFILVGIILGYGVRSVRIIFAIFVSLVVTLIWTMAWAMYSVGELNMISASFAVLIVGLGVDFAIHVSLRYHEAIENGVGNKDSLDIAVVGVGAALALAALTTAIGFFSFLPTQYKGIADLGLIAGGGMACAFMSSLTVLPVLLSLLGSRSGRLVGRKFTQRMEGFYHGVSRHAVLISLFALVVGGCSIAFARNTSFDFSTLTLKGNNSPAIETLKRLQELGISTDYSVYLLAENAEEATQIAQILKALPSVSKVELPMDYVPKDQDLKLAMIEDVSFSYLPVLDQKSQLKSPTNEEQLAAVENLEQTLRSIDEASDEGGRDIRVAAHRLADVLRDLRQARDVQDKIVEFDHRLVGDINEPLDFLRKALFVDPVTFEDLPQELRSRLISPDGYVRVVGIPANDISNFDDMKEFVDEILAKLPQATGRPVLEASVGELVVQSFRTALVIALVCISLLLLIFVRSITDTIFIMAPLLLAALFTVATSVLVGLPFNQANIIVLPLIMGMGVANGIHLLLRFRENGSMDALLQSNTPLAVVLSTLTTIAAFGALAVSSHAGIRSMGLLLTIAMGYLLICTIMVLPALLYTRLRFTNSKHPKPSTTE